MRSISEMGFRLGTSRNWERTQGRPKAPQPPRTLGIESGGPAAHADVLDAGSGPCHSVEGVARSRVGAWQSGLGPCVGAWQSGLLAACVSESGGGAPWVA